MNDFGIKVSEEGYDVSDADDKNMLLKTGLYLLKVFDEGVLDNSNNTETVAHDLGYEPQFLIWNNSNGFKLGAAIRLVTGLQDVGYSYVDDEDLFIGAPMAQAVEAYYHIFYEPLSTGTAPSNPSSNDFGIKVTVDGADVSDANILEQTYNSEKNSIKILLEGDDSNTVNTSFNFLINHGQSFIPGFLVFFEVDNSGKWFSVSEKDTLSGKNVVVDAGVDGTRLTVNCTSSSSCTVKIKYYLLANPAQ